jgi:hypothetical protein
MTIPSSRWIIPDGDIPKKEAREGWYDTFLFFQSEKKDPLHIHDMIFIGQQWLDTII